MKKIVIIATLVFAASAGAAYAEVPGMILGAFSACCDLASACCGKGASCC